ncbi:lysM and putative peptidoglycan-binding domain-containing protein 1 isoform X2 [Dendropsophus ebraccatus]|uniref:lysM and putative peptidoglycan-binding domain-containing protein 1 isoform X2 n=1 Tax=Dendropsophus ebraccatus TaxID=150705 RepID=UPI003831FE87
MASREGDSGLLRGSRTRSYGSLVQTPYSPARVRKVDHLVQPGDTLQGLALKYGVTMEQIKRANRLYTNDSIFLKKYLSIPVPFEQPELTNGESPTEGSETAGEKTGTASRPQRSMSVDARKDDVTVVDFMTKLDTRIRVSKRAAVKKMKEVESVQGRCKTAHKIHKKPPHLGLESKDKAFFTICHSRRLGRRIL